MRNTLRPQVAALIVVKRAERQVEFERMNGLPLAGGSRMPLQCGISVRAPGRFTHTHTHTQRDSSQALRRLKETRSARTTPPAVQGKTAALEEGCAGAYAYACTCACRVDHEQVSTESSSRHIAPAPNQAAWERRKASSWPQPTCQARAANPQCQQPLPNSLQRGRTYANR